MRVRLLLGSGLASAPRRLQPPSRTWSSAAGLRPEVEALGESIEIVGVFETDDCPRVPVSGLAEALNAVVAVFEHELAVAVRNDHGRELLTLGDHLLHLVDAVVPVVVVDRNDDGVARRPGEP